MEISGVLKERRAQMLGCSVAAVLVACSTAPGRLYKAPKLGWEAFTLAFLQLPF